MSAIWAAVTVGLRQRRLQPAVGLGHGGQLADAAHHVAQRFLSQEVLKIEAALDDVFQLPTIAGLGDVLMGE